MVTNKLIFLTFYGHKFFIFFGSDQKRGIFVRTNITEMDKKIPRKDNSKEYNFICTYRPEGDLTSFLDVTVKTNPPANPFQWAQLYSECIIILNNEVNHNLGQVDVLSVQLLNY